MEAIEVGLAVVGESVSPVGIEEGVEVAQEAEMAGAAELVEAG